MTSRGGRPPLSDEPLLNGRYQAPQSLFEDFEDLCRKFGARMKAKFIRVWMTVCVELPEQTVRLLWALAEDDEARASAIALRWFSWGAEREIAGGLPPGMEEVVLPDPEARDAAEEALEIGRRNTEDIGALKEGQKAQGDLLAKIAQAVGVTSDNDQGEDA